MTNSPEPINSNQIPESLPKTNYPEPFKALMNDRIKRKLGNHFGLSNFGVNLTTLQCGGMSALKHCHSHQDEFIYIIEGTVTLIYGDREYVMNEGDCMGFKAGENTAHQLVNKSSGIVTYLEIGDRSANDEVTYPDDDLAGKFNENGKWQFLHKNGEPYS